MLAFHCLHSSETGGPRDEIVTLCVQKYNVIMSRHDMASWLYLILEKSFICTINTRTCHSELAIF